MRAVQRCALRFQWIRPAYGPRLLTHGLGPPPPTRCAATNGIPLRHTCLGAGWGIVARLGAPPYSRGQFRGSPDKDGLESQLPAGPLIISALGEEILKERFALSRHGTAPVPSGSRTRNR
jgi:hypothetical protein